MKRSYNGTENIKNMEHVWFLSSWSRLEIFAAFALLPVGCFGTGLRTLHYRICSNCSESGFYANALTAAIMTIPCPNHDAYKGLEREDPAGRNVLQSNGGEYLVIVHQGPLGTVEGAVDTVGLHQDVTKLGPLGSHDAVNVLVGNSDLGCLAGFTQNGANGQLKEFQEEDSEVHPT
uniref:Uncharacterized protein n=1 Tax=Attheya septentrionalis TaxID=420275 RepID=A0A7S2UK78_9STRA|mmetsp:Transcript_26475/g.48032  ORF Transcript_26475/g.48032 Transcript_26475/m.48032 type:complete len:176 (+) Transcript_26475:268-795(+)